MFRILGITIAVAIAAGYLTGGRLRGLGELKFRATPLIFVSLVLGMLPLVLGTPSGLSKTLVLLGNLGVLAFVLVNIAAHTGVVRAGLAVILLGWFLNALVITANGAMPLSEWAYAESGQTDTITSGEGGFFKIEVAGPDTVLKPLGDVIPIEPLSQVLSIGDLLLMAGIGIVIVGGMRRRVEVQPSAA